MDEKMRILALSGSLPLMSSNGRLLSLASKRLTSLGHEVKIWDFAEKELPVVGSEGSWDDPTVKSFQELATTCDGFLLSTPEYHGSFSSLIKHQLDWLYGTHVGGRPFGLISTLGGRSSNNALNHLRIVVRWLHGHCIPEQIALPHAKDVLSDDGELVDDEISKRLDSLLVSLISHAKFYRQQRLQDD